MWPSVAALEFKGQMIKVNYTK